MAARHGACTGVAVATAQSWACPVVAVEQQLVPGLVLPQEVTGVGVGVDSVVGSLQRPQPQMLRQGKSERGSSCFKQLLPLPVLLAVSASSPLAEAWPTPQCGCIVCRNDLKPMDIDVLMY
eukprot:153479-Prymnesium_polylepis.2